MNNEKSKKRNGRGGEDEMGRKGEGERTMGRKGEGEKKKLIRKFGNL